MEEQGMSWQEAMNVLEAVKSRYQGFEKLEQIARLLATHNQAAQEAKAHAAELDRQITQKRKVAKSLDDRTVELEGLIRSAEKRYQAAQEEWEAKLAELQKQYQQVMNSLETDRKAIQASNEAAHHARVSEMERELDALTAKRDGLWKQIESFKARIGGL